MNTVWNFDILRAGVSQILHWWETVFKFGITVLRMKGWCSGIKESNFIYCLLHYLVEWFYLLRRINSLLSSQRKQSVLFSLSLFLVGRHGIFFFVVIHNKFTRCDRNFAVYLLQFSFFCSLFTKKKKILFFYWIHKHNTHTHKYPVYSVGFPCDAVEPTRDGSWDG